MSARSRKKKDKGKFKWVDGPNGTSTLEDRRTAAEKARDQVKANGAARRADQIASGINPTSGCGVHDKTKKQKHRDDRRRNRENLRRGDHE